MAIELYRVDDRLVHGQVVLGWGQPMCAGFIVLVDDVVAGNDWERELYRMGTPPGKGVIDWKSIFAKADLGGIKHYFVEHDEPKDPFASAQTSYEYLAKLRF